jgi:hypothetical protein
VRWVAANLGLFIGLQALYVAVLAATIRAPLGIGLTILVVAAFLTLPMLPVYLAVVGRLPARWTDGRRRAAAIAASPLLLALFAMVLGAFAGGTGLFLLGVAVPGSLIYGSLVRLRRNSGHRLSLFHATRE